MNLPLFPIILFVLIACFISVLGQLSTEGFISLDCGLASNSSYTDSSTGIPYTSDYQYISNTGPIYTISSNLINPSLPKQFQTLRSFPNGTRNCYTLQPVIPNQKYIVRAGFMYGNYDGLNNARLNNPLQFGLHLDANEWVDVNITSSNNTYYYEVLSMAFNDFVSVCLVNTGFGTPFLSLLELRPLNSSMYEIVNATHSLVLHTRLSLGPPTGKTIRYPSDPQDLIWHTFSGSPVWTELSTVSTVFTNNKFGAPSLVLQNAATPFNSSILQFSIGDGNSSTAYYFVFHFAELLKLSSSDLRAFDLYYNGDRVYPYYTPLYLYADPLYTDGFFSGAEKHSFALNATRNSTLPPLINALESYKRMLLTNLMTDLSEAKAMMAIKEQYRISKNWMGDPCNPIQYVWQGVSCSYENDNSQIIALNLSFSGLTGQLSANFSTLQKLQSLDVSHNHLNGTIPDFLANMASLKALNLTGNNFVGNIPEGLLQKANAGLLDLRYDSYTSPLTSKNKKKISTMLIIIIPIAGLLLVFLVALIVWIIAFKKSSGSQSTRQGNSRDAPIGIQARVQLGSQPTRQISSRDEPMGVQIPPIQNINRNMIPNIQIDGKEFKYFQLEIMTQNFSRVLGKGGFGTIYHGKLEDGTEIAAKVSWQPSAQGTKEFLAEARSLTKVHHKTLVSLIGYCMERNCLALIYEYMPMGSLKDHLTGRAGSSRVLNWRQRLQIALDASKGLDYLHTGCEIIHRDVKSSNILLGPNLEAKLSDFGFSKFTGNTAQSSYTGIVGTPGYIDPEAHNTLTFTEKSDVYSFGVVLLELITGEPPFISRHDNLHISKRVASKLAGGNIDAIVDMQLHGNYSSKSAWKVVDMAMSCVDPSSPQRPAMAEVVIKLKECLDMEILRDKSGRDDMSQSLEAVEFKTMTFAPSAR